MNQAVEALPPPKSDQFPLKIKGPNSPTRDERGINAE